MVITELYTRGGEFELPDGTNYIGAYHVHITSGAMVGGFHKTETHDRLTPSNQEAKNLIKTFTNQLKSQQRLQARMQEETTPSPSSSSGGSSGGGSGGY
jgi:hypothetical protein